MAECLTRSPDDTVFETAFSVISSTQISGSPLPTYGQPVVRGSDVDVEFTS